MTTATLYSAPVAVNGRLYPRTEIVSLNGEISKIVTVSSLLAAYAGFAGIMVMGGVNGSLPAIFTGAGAAGVHTGFVAAFSKGYFELHGDEFAVEEHLGNPTNRVYVHGWGFYFWPTRSIKKFVAKDSYTAVPYAARSYDNVAVSGVVVTASKISPNIAQRDGRWRGSARIWHIAGDAARVQKRNLATETEAEWVMSGFRAAEIHKTHDLQNVMLSARLRLHAFDDFLRAIGVEDVDKAREVRLALDKPADKGVVTPFFDFSKQEVKERFDELFKSKVVSCKRVLIALLQDEDPDKDHTRHEYSSGEEFQHGCAFKDRTLSKSWSEAQERRAAAKAIADSFNIAAAAALAAKSDNPAGDAQLMLGTAQGIVMHSSRKAAGGGDAGKISEAEEAWMYAELLQGLKELMESKLKNKNKGKGGK